MRKAFTVTAMLLLAQLPSLAAHAQEPEVIQTVEMKVGDQTFLKLPGNPKAGYKWRLNEQRSQGLDRVSVKLIGWLMAQRGKSKFFQEQSVMNISLSGMASGEANIAFDYYRRFLGRIVSRTSMVRVSVTPRRVSQ